ncbi:MAG: flagellar basal body P-ring formation chaperone FlgA [Gemmatimonadaceae bacterium]|nr:flagellar basal body P-ring formation chaperone FlgA [Gemmatimonadaceae bacterium]
MSALVAFAFTAAVVPPIAAQESAAATTPVAARVIPRGRILTDDDIAEVPATAGERPMARRPVSGWISRRLIAAGEPLREPSVTPPVDLLPGDTVKAVRRSGGVTLALRGTALQSASIGDKVAVRVDAKRRLEGTLTAPRLVVLP